MNLFCCEEMCDEPNQEEIYEPRRSNYKLTNYSSQSTESQYLATSPPVSTIIYAKKVSEPLPRSTQIIHHATSFSPQKHLHHPQTYYPVSLKAQNNRSFKHDNMLKPNTPISELLDFMREDKSATLSNNLSTPGSINSFKRKKNVIIHR